MSTDAFNARDERVTRCPVRDVTLPDGAGVMALITMDNGFDHTKPTTFGPQGLANLSAALDQIVPRATAGEIVAVGITGKPFIFCAGADLSQVAGVSTPAQAQELAHAGHATFRRLDELDVPSFAFVNGPAMGGGLEVALNCTYRTISAGAKAVALPECVLGLLPGWGGVYLLPRLVGIVDALRVIVQNPLEQNRMTRPGQAHQMGMADAVLEPAEFLEDSLRWAAGVLIGQVRVDRKDSGLDDRRTWDGAIAQARALLDSRTGGIPPAPYRALDLLSAARTSDRDTAFAAEDTALADLIMTDEFRAGVYAFNLMQSGSKRPAGAPDPDLARPVRKIGIVGAGLMASQLALLFARHLKVPVVMTDLDAQRVEQGLRFVHGEVDKLAGKGRIGSDEARRITDLVTGRTSKDGFADADFVIEAVFEDMSVKQQVFAEVEAVIGPQCVLATNTSSLSVTEMASHLAHPERVVGFHFFNPVAVMPLVEVVQAEKTDRASLTTALSVARQLRKTAVLAGDSTSFIVNRLLGRFFADAGELADQGVPPSAVDAATAGVVPMPPFELLELVGPAIALHNGESLNAAWPDRFAVPASLRKVVAAGLSSYYLPAQSPAVPRELDPRVRDLLSTSDTQVSSHEIRARILRSLAQEARIMLDEQVVAQPQDLDLAMITGAGFLFWNGGLTPLLDRTGIAREVTGGRFLPPGVASVPESVEPASR